MKRKQNTTLNFNFRVFLNKNGLKVNYFAHKIGISKQALRDRFNRGLTTDQKREMLSTLRDWLQKASAEIPRFSAKNKNLNIK